MLSNNYNLVRRLLVYTVLTKNAQKIEQLKKRTIEPANKQTDQIN